ncbi:hypothetical protein BDV97DRAFT_157979 [Delphinella strobiligena]|nr:hypothetical protein BDV97DRAFT_157979 [Delphinella strobiligena]
MVELRSGRRVDFSQSATTNRSCTRNKAVIRSNSDVDPSPRMTKRSSWGDGPDVEIPIYEDDPNATRFDIDVLPFDCWETGAHDKENEEPCLDVPTGSHMAEGLSTTRVRETHETGPGQSSAARFILHEIPQDDFERRWRPTPHSPKKLEPAEPRRKAEPSSFVGQAGSAKKRSPPLVRSGLKRVNVMDLR